MRPHHAATPSMNLPGASDPRAQAAATRRQDDGSKCVARSDRDRVIDAFAHKLDEPANALAAPATPAFIRHQSLRARRKKATVAAVAS